MPDCARPRIRGMHIVGTFLDIDHLEVDQVAGQAEFVADAVAAQHVTGHSGDIQGLATAVALPPIAASHE